MPLTRKHTILAKLESTKGADAVPVAADAVQVIEPEYGGPNYEIIEREYANDDLDSDLAEVGRGTAELSMQTVVRGSGNASATPPEDDVMLRSCGMQRADVGDLDIGSSSGRFALGQEISDNATDARAICMDPTPQPAGTVRVWKVPDSLLFVNANNIDLETGPNLIQAPVVAALAFATSKFGYRPESEERTKHGIGTYTTTAPAVGEIVIYRDGITTEVVAAGIVRAINDGTDQEVELYFATRALKTTATADNVARALNASHFTPITAPVTLERSPSASLYSFKDGMLRKLLGGHGTFSLEVEAGQSAKFTYTYQGSVDDPVDAVTPSGIVYPTTVGPRFVGGIAELNGTRFQVKKVSLEYAAVVVDELNANAPSGADGAVITNREPVMTWEIKYPGIANFDLPAFLKNAATLVGGIVLGTASGNQITLVAPRLQVVDLQDADNDGVMGWTIVMRCRRRSGPFNGDDSLLFDYN